MRTKLLLTAVAAVCLLSGGLSFADDRDRGNKGWQHKHHGPQWKETRHDARHDAYPDPRRDARDGRWNDRRPYYNARGPDFYRGGYIAHEYRGHMYAVDYRTHYLSRPPHGHRWVQVGADYVLIAVATGIIAHIILSH